MNNNKFNPKENILGSVSPYKKYCDGFKSPGSSGKGYVNSLILSIGKTSLNLNNDGSNIINEILAYDDAETKSAYIGQINMTIVSSFSGPNGLIWGHDIARADSLKEKHPLLQEKTKGDKGMISIYNIEPLLKASESLFGFNRERHFPLLPGSHVPCAGRFLFKKGPCHIYSALSISIPKDRSKSASLLMEDVGIFNNDREETKKIVLENLIESALAIGENQQLEFEKIFVGLKEEKIKKGETGCALVAMPYFTLAQNAIVKGNPEELLNLSLSEWEKKSKEFFLN
jgi:histidine decarboxylase